MRILPLARTLLTLNAEFYDKILNFRDQNFFWGPHPTLGCALARLVQGTAPPKGQNVVSRKKSTYGVNLLSSITFSFVDQSTPTFFAQRGRGCRFSRAIPILDLLICSGDIRDQSRKLSKIAKNFGRFFGGHKF